MGKINWGRVAGATIVTGIFYFIADGIIHGAILSQHYVDAFKAAGKPIEQDPSAYVFFGAFDLGKAFVAVLTYVNARARFAPGVKTAAWSGALAWLACEVLPAIAAMPFPFYERTLYVKIIALEFLPMVIGAILGAWIYKEAPADAS